MEAHTTRQEIEGKLDDLRRKRGLAIEQGRGFNSQPIHDLEDQLDGLGDAESERTRRQRAEEHAAYEKNWDAVWGEYQAEEKLFLEDLRAAQAGYRQGNQRTESAHLRLKKLATLYRSLGIEERGVPSILSADEFRREIGARLSADAVAQTKSARLGNIEWKMHSRWSASEDWADQFAARLNEQVNPNERKENQNGKGSS